MSNPAGSGPSSELTDVDVLERQARIERRAGRRYLTLFAIVAIWLALLTVSNVIGLVLVHQGLTQRLADRDRTIATQTLKISDRDKAIGTLVDEVILLQRQVKSLGGTPAPFTITIPPR